MGNIAFKCMGSSTKKSVQYPETSRIPKKHEIANNKRNEKKKTVPSTQPNIPPEKRTVPSTQPNIHPEKRSTVPSSQLPPEIIIEILSWLPVKNLLRLKCVCKQWYAIIQDHHFIKKHMSRAIVATNQYNKIVAEVPAAGSYRFICGCDGLLLKMRNASYKYYIQNPTTYQILELPDPQKGSFDISFSFIPSTGDYKLVSVYNDGNEAGNEGCEVLTVGTDDSWRALKFPNLHDDDLNKKRERTSVVSAGSTVHFIWLFNAAESDKYQEVVSLDLETECFTVTAMSRDSLPGWEKFQALSWNGKLSFVNRVEEGLHVLVLEDHKKQKWGVKFVIPLAFLKENQEMMVNLVPLFAQRGDLWFSWKQEKVFAYNMDSGTIGHTILAPEGHRISKQVYRCPPSLVTLKGMRSEKTQPQMNQPS